MPRLGQYRRKLAQHDILIEHIVVSDLGMPHARALGKGLFEVRAKAEEGIGRVFYCTLVGEHMVMLHTFAKKTQTTPDKELRIARRRMKEIKDAES